jgi:macrodomain Ter protein organizer (MatP/YcbG family)
MYMAETIKARVMFTCEHEVKEKLIQWAKSEKRTVSNLVEKLIEEAIDKYNPTHEKEAS